MNAKVLFVAACLTIVGILWAISLWALLLFLALLLFAGVTYGCIAGFYKWYNTHLDTEFRQASLKFEHAKHQALITGTLDGSNIKVTPDGSLELIRSVLPGRVTAREVPQMALPEGIPGPYQFSQELVNWRPSPQGLFIGRTAQGALYVPSDKTWHIALTGPTGGGKSTILRMVLAQLIFIGEACILLDKHYAPMVDGADWTPIANKLAMDVLRKPHEMVSYLKWLSETELERRIDARYNQEPESVPMYIAVEELPALVDEEPDAATYIGRILREGRKFGIRMVGATQDMLVKTLGSSSGIRECYRTAYYVGGDMHTARAVLDLPPGYKLDEQGLGVDGLVYVKTALTQVQRARVPFADNQAIALLAGEAPVTDRLPIYTPDEAEPAENSSISDQTIYEHLDGGMSYREVIEELGVSMYNIQRAVGRRKQTA